MPVPQRLILPFSLLAAVIATTFVAASPAHALPIFARRYGMSCTTCHAGGPPVLSAFGEAFRDNGYRIPGDDASFVVAAPVALGAPARAALFPNTMWPGELPGQTPIAFTALAGIEYTAPAHRSPDKSELEFPLRARLLVAGSLGDHFSVLGSLSFYEGELELDQLFLVARSLFDDALGEMVLNVKIGQLYPEVNPMQPTLRRAITESYLLSSPVARDGFTLARPSPGLELYGVLAGRVKWLVGVVNGNKPIDDLTSRRDLFARLSANLGGAREDYQGPTTATDDAVVSLGGLVYWGSAVNVPGPTDTFARYTNDILRAGGDARLRVAGLDVLAQLVFGRDTGATTMSDELLHVGWSVDAEYRIFPWLIPYARYEEVRYLNLPAPSDVRDQRRTVFGAAVFIRANIRVRVEGAIGLSPNDPSTVRGDLFFAL